MADIHNVAMQRAIERAKHLLDIERKSREAVEKEIDAKRLEREDKVNAAKHGARRGSE